jgi:hypothetical protein
LLCNLLLIKKHVEFEESAVDNMYYLRHVQAVFSFRTILATNFPVLCKRPMYLLISGDADETMTCNENPCPAWTDWSQWSACTVTCGGGKRIKERECVLPGGEVVADEQCLRGVADMEEECNENKCPGKCVLLFLGSLSRVRD